MEPRTNTAYQIVQWASIAMMLAIIAMCLCTGCVTTRFHNEYQTPDGKISTTDYRGISAAWPLGKLDTTAHKLETQYGSNSHVSLGTDASGLDNTSQAAIMQAIIEAAIKASASAKVTP